jgi:hydroxymethylglutaryl-CoA lyase
MKIHIVEVGPRDGFQMEKDFIPTPLKVEIINRLSRTGIRKIEATSFVNSKVIPQMADAAEVIANIDRVPGVSYTALVPNLKGAQRAIDQRVDAIRVVVCATETYNQRNIGQTTSQTLKEFEQIFHFSAAQRVSAEAIIGLSFGCPLEGPVAPSTVVKMVRALIDIGFLEISIADTIGVASPRQVRALMGELVGLFPAVKFSLHPHDTRGLGLANVLAAMDAGINTFDSSLGGLGGCPIFPAATGNISTEDLANLLNEMEFDTGVDTEAVVECSRVAQTFLGRALPSHVLRAGTRQQLFNRLQVFSEGGTSPFS